MNVRPEFLAELAVLLRRLAGPDCSCRLCLDARIAADQIDRELTQQGELP